VVTPELLNQKHYAREFQNHTIHRPPAELEPAIIYFFGACYRIFLRA